VWSYKIEANHRIIYYSKSEDEGQSWGDPEKASQQVYGNKYIQLLATDNSFS